jgi:hypothetical protein
MKYLILVANGVHYKLCNQETLDVLFGDELDIDYLVEWLDEIAESNEFIVVKTDMKALFPDFIKANTIEKVYIKE